MAKVTTTFEIQNSYANWLSSIPWSHFGTFTTGYEMTLPTARRLMGSLHQQLTRAGPAPLFWVAEKFEVKDGYHTHALLKLPEAWRYKNVVDIWQKVTGAKKKGTWHRLDLQDYNPELGARHYVAKYITKQCADFDFLLN
jgi:hypothetical protein